MVEIPVFGIVQVQFMNVQSESFWNVPYGESYELVTVYELNYATVEKVNSASIKHSHV